MSLARGWVEGGCQEHLVSFGYLRGVRDDVLHRQLSLALQGTAICGVCVCVHVCVCVCAIALNVESQLLLIYQECINIHIIEYNYLSTTIVSQFSIGLLISIFTFRVCIK